MFKRIRDWIRQRKPQAETGPPAAEPARKSEVRIDFGANKFHGANISFGNVTGGSLIQNIDPWPGPEHVELSPYASEEHLRDLQAAHLENRTLLRQQIERFGDYVPGHLVWQLKDTERYLAEIELRLAQLSRPAE